MEELNQPTPPTEDTTSAPASADADVTPAASEVPDWRQLLNTVPPDDLIRHPRVAGIVGDKFDKWQRRHAEEIRETTTREIRSKQDAELFRLLDENPDVLKEQYPLAYEGLVERRREAERESAEKRIRQVQVEIAEQIGLSYRELPEWASVSSEDLDRLARATAGKPEKESVAAFAKEVADILAEKKAETKFRKWEAEEREKIRQAVRQEEAAARLASTEAPDTRRPGGKPKFDPTKLSDAEFEVHWRNHIRKI